MRLQSVFWLALWSLRACVGLEDLGLSEGTSMWLLARGPGSFPCVCTELLECACSVTAGLQRESCKRAGMKPPRIGWPSLWSHRHRQVTKSSLHYKWRELCSILWREEVGRICGHNLKQWQTRNHFSPAHMIRSNPPGATLLLPG